MRFDTRLIHSGQPPTPGTGDIVPPIHMATTYDRFQQDPPRHFYSRGENPTREALEECLAALEDARHCAVFSSGQAAATAALSLLTPGQRLVSSRDVYGGTYALFEVLSRYGIRVDYADFTDSEQLRRVLSTEAAMVWVETPSNPLLELTDLTEVVALARGATVVVDNTFASPALQRPLDLGAQVSLYSTTKFIAGHADVLGGALVCDIEALHRRFVAHRTVTGGVPGGLDCYLVHRGVKTLSLRVARQGETAQLLAEMLAAAPAVAEVKYPGLPTHPQRHLVGTQMSGPGSIVSFRYRGDPEKLMARTELFACAVSLGGVRSLIECPALMTHRPIPRETRLAVGITDDLIRLSAGIEDPADLVADLRRAMEGDR
ncbi:PLP-dependent transferase [Nocardia panacis]|uniref:homocysteine desulfhydrase n=1 Tax=Nocardia panacis TaxID=2340916 RepID=A0A3A4KGG6_9NOCA|nr:aminotransferase class I/II-fold pyridoxal phosphate-dependent enzyme [Nocardia panacis]RJO72521.1 PLP-dependent transferase [Nocardia panacis]